MRSPVYWHPLIYRIVMQAIYGKHYKDRYSIIAELVPENASVTEVCAGDGYLYKNYLSGKGVRFTGLDANLTFVRNAQKTNIPLYYHNLITDAVPSADYVIMQASLYQFIPHEHDIITKLLDAARHTLIIAEPVRNLADSSNKFISFLAKYSANPGNSHALKRFDEKSLIGCFRKYSEFSALKEMKGGREIIGIFKKQ